MQIFVTRGNDEYMTEEEQQAGLVITRCTMVGVMG